MKIALASDHAGFRYKGAVHQHLVRQGHEVMDFGTLSDDPCDYPVFVRPAAMAVAEGKCAVGFVFGGSGNGEAMVANRVPKIRCAVGWDMRSTKLAREHNDANMLSIGQRMVPEEQALEMVDLFLSEPFEGGRHENRIRLIDEPDGP